MDSSPHRPSRPVRCAAGLCAVLLPLFAAAAPAPAAAPVAATATAAWSAADAESELQRWVEQSAMSAWTARSPGETSEAPAEAGAADAGHPGVRVEVRVGRLHPGARLAPCTRIEPFLPPNARLWGRGYIGARCTQGASWSTMIPVTVSVFGPALVANLPLAMGSVPQPADFRIEEVDWTRNAGTPVSDPALLAGRSLGRPLSAGQVLQANDLRVQQTVAAGDPVRIRVIGHGFSISASGYAVTAAGEGQSLRVRTEAGKMLVGTVRERAVEVRL